MDKIWYLIVDDQKFQLFKSSLDNHKNSLLWKVLNGDVDDKRIMKENSNVFIDADPKSFNVIVSYLRGYEIVKSNFDDDLVRKIIYDAKYFNFNGLVNLLVNDIKSVNIEQLDDLLDSSEISEISDVEINIQALKEKFNIPEEQEEQEEELPTYNSNILNNGNKTEIDNFLKQLQQGLQSSNQMGVMHFISTDPHIINYTKKQQNNVIEEINSNEEDEELEYLGDLEITECISSDSSNRKIRTKYVNI